MAARLERTRRRNRQHPAAEEVKPGRNGGIGDSAAVRFSGSLRWERGYLKKYGRSILLLFVGRQRLRLHIGHRRDGAELQAGLYGGEAGAVAFFGQVEVAFIAAGAQKQGGGKGGEQGSHHHQLEIA